MVNNTMDKLIKHISVGLLFMFVFGHFKTNFVMEVAHICIILAERIANGT